MGRKNKKKKTKKLKILTKKVEKYLNLKDERWFVLL